jgi:hypothetical protein
MKVTQLPVLKKKNGMGFSNDGDGYRSFRQSGTSSGSVVAFLQRVSV